MQARARAEHTEAEAEAERQANADAMVGIKCAFRWICLLLCFMRGGLRCACDYGMQARARAERTDAEVEEQRKDNSSAKVLFLSLCWWRLLRLYAPFKL